MGILKPREKEILRYLRQGKSAEGIGRFEGTPITKGRLKFPTPNRDPKALSKERA